jgi:hypothetical protein
MAGSDTWRLDAFSDRYAALLHCFADRPLFGAVANGGRHVQRCRIVVLDRSSGKMGLMDTLGLAQPLAGDGTSFAGASSRAGR